MGQDEWLGKPLAQPRNTIDFRELLFSDMQTEMDSNFRYTYYLKLNKRQNLVNSTVIRAYSALKL